MRVPDGEGVASHTVLESCVAVSRGTTRSVGKCLEHLRQVVPRVKHIAVLWQPNVLPGTTERELVKEAEIAARALGVQLQSSRPRRLPISTGPLRT